MPYRCDQDQRTLNPMTNTLPRIDDKLIISVRQALRQVAELEGTTIFATVDGGAASLYGRVGHKAQAVAAERAVLAVDGVLAVAQHLFVSHAHRVTDSDIARRAAEALRHMPSVPSTVRVTVQDGTLTLSGEVNWQYERDAACRAVADIDEARAVISTITVASGTLAIHVQADITAALAGSPDPAQVTVGTNSQGAIVIDGVVRSAADRTTVEAICAAVPGVLTVNNRLMIHPGP